MTSRVGRVSDGFGKVSGFLLSVIGGNAGRGGDPRGAGSRGIGRVVDRGGFRGDFRDDSRGDSLDDAPDDAEVNAEANAVHDETRDCAVPSLIPLKSCPSSSSDFRLFDAPRNSTYLPSTSYQGFAANHWAYSHSFPHNHNYFPDRKSVV